MLPFNRKIIFSGVSLLALLLWAGVGCRAQKQGASSQKIVSGSLSATGTPTELLPRATVLVVRRTLQVPPPGAPASSRFYTWALCTGSLIADYRVLTAAHCVEDDADPQHYRVFIGKNHWSDQETSDAFKSVEGAVRQVRAHPFTDLATLDLVAKAPPHSLRMPLPAPASLARFAVGSQTITGGFGDYRERVVGEVTNAKGQIERQVVKDARTSDDFDLRWISTSYSKFRQEVATEKGHKYQRMLEFKPAANGGSTCSGDSGGPTLWNDGGRWVQVGVLTGGKINGICTGSVYDTPNLFDAEFQAWIYDGVPLNDRPAVLPSSNQTVAGASTGAGALPVAKPPVPAANASVTSVNQPVSSSAANVTEPEFVDFCPQRPALRNDFLAAGYRYLIQTKRAASVVRGSSNPQDPAYAATVAIPPCAEIYARAISVDGAYFWVVADLKVLSPHTGRIFELAGRRYLARVQFEDPAVCQGAPAAACVRAAF